jgi:5-methylcytosine-specific restriction enzyme A
MASTPSAPAIHPALVRTLSSFVSLLLSLREQGLVRLPEGRIMRNEHGRVVVLAGRRRDRDSPDQQSSKVTKRLLDSMAWGVAAYDEQTGDFTLVRDLSSRLVDQFTVQAATDTPSETYTVTGQVYVRNPVVRQQALKRAGGKCEWCGEPGFQMADGSVFLETHHIRALSDGGPDVVTNVAALCPNHHREAHYGANRQAIYETLRHKIGEEG